MALKIKVLEPPLISAYLLNIRLLKERAELFLDVLEGLKGQVGKVDARAEQQWNVNAALAEREGDKQPHLLIDVSLQVVLVHQESGSKLGELENTSRATFEIAGMIGDLTEDALPTKCIEAYLIMASDRVRMRCQQTLSAMGTPIQLASPRDFTEQPQKPPESEHKPAAPSRKKRKRKIDLSA